jgi:GT2 family glycosyltransferase
LTLEKLARQLFSSDFVSDALCEELARQLFSSDFVSDELCKERLGNNKLSIGAMRRYLQLSLGYRPDISIFFDRQYYCSRYPDFKPEETDPFLHFLVMGCAQGRSPHPLIDPGYIDSADKHLFAGGCGIGKLYEVLLYNLADPSPYFSLTYYRGCLAEDEDISKGLLAHFLSQGLNRGLKPHPLFDPLWYAASQIDDPSDPLSAMRHFVLQGDLEGRPPSPTFSGTRYFQRYPDVARAGSPALAHYLTHGRAEGRDYLPEQDDAVPLEAALRWRLNEAEVTVDATKLLSTYHSMRQRIAKIRQEEKDKVSVDKPPLAHFKELKRNIARLALPRVRNPRVSILVPFFNEVSHTVECVASIIHSKTRTRFEVVMADDASTDQSVSILSKIGNLRIIRQELNVGFLENCNKAYKACKGEFILLLNNDAQLTPGCLDIMVDALDGNPDAAAVGPKILYPDGRLQEAGCTLDRDGISTMVGLFADPTRPEYNYKRDVHYCSGAALMVRRSEVGDRLFDDRFKPAYCEDADLCLRLLSRGRRVIYVPQAEVVHHLSVSADKRSSFRRLQTVTSNQQKLTEKWSNLLEDINTARVIAFYLPQFHTTPENDFYWGQGFTEWTNVAKATPGYAGHYQPHLPADLGFYDLRVRQTIERQSALACRYGIDGFCVYYYNFGRQRALDQAFETIVADRTIPFPYCICWANENWTRHWDGGSREIIFEQQYDEEALCGILRDAVRYGADPRYIRVDGKPLFLVYRPRLIPDPQAFAALARDAFLGAGNCGVHLVYVESMETAAAALPPADLGFDASVEFPPHGRSVRADDPVIMRDDFVGTRYDYEATVIEDVSRPLPGYKRYPAVFPSWDNTPRQPQRGDSFIGATPEAFQVYVEEKLEYLRQFLVGHERLLFVNAWNEWAEGTHLEPDQKYGHRWLEAIRNARMVKSLA